MKRRVIIIGALTIAVSISAFTLVDGSTAQNTNNPKSQTVSENIELSYFGINGGLTVNNNNGRVSQFIAGEMDLYYRVQGKYARSMMNEQYRQTTTQEKLQKANLVSDLIPNYPKNWIIDYTSVEIMTTYNGIEKKEVSPNEVLSLEQKNLFNSVEMSTAIGITVKYKLRNVVTDILENREMKVSMAVVPDAEAEYMEGYDQMITYLKENSLCKINAKHLSYLPQPSLSFTVNEIGSIEKVVLKETSGNVDIDKMLIELIEKMPKWKPAKNIKGVAVKQEFVLIIGQDGC